MSWLWQSLYEAAAMFWEVLWALVFGFAVSALLQVFVSREQMTKALGRPGLREVALATALGAASSSCSYAAVAAAKTAFKKGAALVPTLAFMFASTNLVFELGIVLWVLLGWRFVLAEFVGAFVLIAVMWLLVRLTLPQGLEQEARDHSEDGGTGHDHHHHSGMAERSKPAQIADAFAMDWAMVRREIILGFLIAGLLTVVVRNSVWQTLFLVHSGSPWLRSVENAVAGPLIAVASFVCSVGNIPLASTLWSGGIRFGGVIAFIYADLIVAPIVVIYVRYYGRRMAAYITGVLLASMIAAGLGVDMLFTLLHLVPDGPRPPSAIASAQFAWNYTTWLDLTALLLAGGLAVLHYHTEREQDNL